MELLLLQPQRTTPERTTHNAQRTTHNAQRTTHNAQRTTHNAQPPTVVADSRVQQVIILLAENLQYQWQIQELADAVLMSPRQLERCFKASLDCSPLFYLRVCRLQKAAELLHTTHEQINQIAQQVGIPDTRYFRRSFKELYGVSPGEYRNQAAKANAVHVVFDPQMSEMTPLSTGESPLT